MSKIIRIFLAVFFFLLIPFIGRVYAADDFDTKYKVDYQLKEEGGGITSHANFQISITNKRSDVYVNKFAISFPKSFTISNLKVTDDHGDIKPVIESDDSHTKIEMEFVNPNIGRGSINNLNLAFDQAKLFKVNGNVWEVILPVIENRGDSPYDVTVLLPTTTDKKISISKPVPTSINGREIKWSNPTTRTIYAVFGNSQIYDVSLSYHLKNDKLIPVTTEVAFPPDTLYQRIVLKSMSEMPNKTYQDEDGNFMAVYYLKPKESKNINADFNVEVFTTPRDEVRQAAKAGFQSQKRYLLDSQKYWEIKSLSKISPLKDNREVYDFVTKTLKYSYSRVNADNNIRFGAEKILENPSVAVCMEFTDLYVAAAREKGIYAREIEGYGASSDPQLRPLSLSSDVLHAWPEYFDEVQGLWKPVDPTWENTSGIDYFSSFDLNHIVFAIHGKRSEYPLPAGMYKTENSKDIEVTAITNRAEEREEVDVTDVTIPARITNDKIYNGKITLKNSGNVYMWDVPVEIAADGLVMSNAKAIIPSLAPGQKWEISFGYYAPKKETANKKTLRVLVSGQEIMKREIIFSSFFVDFLIMAGSSLVIIVTAFLIVGKLRS